MSFTPPAATGYSGFFDPAFARPGTGAEADYNAMPRYGRGPIERAIARNLAKAGFRGMRRVMRVLNGAAAGSAANETYTRVGTADQAGPTSAGPGGLRTMEVFTANSGNTTNAQRDYINNQMIDPLFNMSPSSYPVDLSGNGGGGRAGI